VTPFDSLPQLLARKAETPSGDLTPSTPSPGLPPELLASAGRRLAYAALTYAFVYSLTWAVANAAMRMGAMNGMSEDQGPWNTLTILFVATSLGMWGLARSGRVAPAVLLDVALVYEVVGTVGIDIGLLWPPPGVTIEMVQLTWTAVWIVIFPLLVPTTPGKTLVAALISASVKPLFVLIVVARGDIAMPAPGTLLVVAVPNYICAFLAFSSARVVYGLSREVGRARRLGSYRLIDRLGAGGMGEVWRAEHQLLARPAAIKLIRLDAIGGADGDGRRQAMRRFEREARATAALTSPHTVQLHDFGIAEDGTFYYVMELLQGLDADMLVRRFGPQPPERVVHLLAQVCESLAEAHRAGLVHRDIKPANVFLCRRGLVYDFVKVLDFGLVKAAAGSGRDETALTRHETATGTPAFMPPEIATAESDVDGRADVYAVGCLAYWLLTGLLVFEGNEMQMAVAHVGSTPKRPSQRSDRTIPPDLEAVVMDCLEKDRDRRPQSAAELARRLGALPVADSWDREAAAAWWRANLPELAA